MTSVRVTSGLADANPHRMATGRVGLVSQLLTEALTDGESAHAASPSVLDCGGGSGAYAVPLAVDGCNVTVVDISADALATLRRRADEAGVSERVHAVTGDVERLGELFPDTQFDAVLAHGILDAVDGVEATFAEIVRAVRPGGLISVLVANPVASVLARALAGEPAQALRELQALGRPSALVGPDTVTELCAAAGLSIEARHGIGVFSDVVPGAALDTPGARQALADLDAAAADRAPFAELAGRIHLLARRPAG